MTDNRITFKNSQMNTILVLADHSAKSKTAAAYAGMLASAGNSNRIILLHNGVETSADTAGQPEPVTEDIRRSLAASQPSTTVIEARSGALNLKDDLNELCRAEQVDLVVTGIAGGSGNESKELEAGAVRLAEHCQYPLLLVPEDASTAPVSNIVFACDLHKFSKKTPASPLIHLLDSFPAKLLVVNIDHHDHHFEPENFTEVTAIHQLLRKYNPEYHYVDHTSTVQGIIEFATAQNASLIIAIPRKHSFFHGLFHKSVTQGLIYRSAIPILSIHQH